MKIKSIVAEQATGSAGNITASNNANGLYLRARKSPKNPRSVAQTGVRASFAAVSQAYRALTDAQRTGWQALGLKMTTTDRLGTTSALSASQTHSSINGVRAAVGDDPLTDAPSQPDAVPALPSITIDTFRTGNPGGAFVLSVHSDAYADRVMVFATPAESAGVNYFGKSAFRLIETVSSLTAGATTITASYVSKFGTPAAGSRIAVKLVPISANGFKGGEVVETAIVGVSA